LYIGDYFADTLDFSTQEHDALRLILVHIWLTGTVPSTRREFAKIIGVSMRQAGPLQASLLFLLPSAAARIEICKRALAGFVGKRLPAEQWRIARAVVLERDDHVCVYCGSKESLHVDHRIALARGGSNALDNLVTCCGPCNWSKGAKLLDEWVEAKSLSSDTTIGSGVVRIAEYPQFVDQVHGPGDNSKAILLNLMRRLRRR